MHDFNNRVAVVTGAASGIGMAIAHHLLKEGASVAVLDLNAKTLNEQFTKYGDYVHITAIDVTDQSLVENLSLP